MKIYKIGEVEFKVDTSKKKAIFKDGTKITWNDKKQKKEDLFEEW